MRRLVSIGLAATLVLTFAGTTLAANSTKTSPVIASIALTQPVGQAATTSPALGQSVAFTTTIPSTDKSPAIVVNCYQNGTLVWGVVGSVTDSYKLGGDSSPWLTNGGSASCVPQLVNITWHARTESIAVLASTSFDAAP